MPRFITRVLISIPLATFYICISLYPDSEAHNRTAHRSVSYVYIHTEGSPTNFVRKREKRMLPTRLIKAVLERVTIPKRERIAR